jgi:hypothetical protein
MFSGGARIPHAVMPVVFGGAVTITALYTILASGGRLHASPMLWVGIAGMLISIVIITTNTPHAPAGGGGAQPTTSQTKTEAGRSP